MDNNPIDSWSSFSNQLEHWENKGLMFRGVTAAKYRLIPKIGRSEARVRQADQYSLENEKRIFEEFKTHARAYLDKTLNTDVEWLVLAQHHGLPTRLLDWTLSPLIAAYFAVEKMGAHTRGPDENPEDYLPAIYVAPILETPKEDLSDFEIFPMQPYGNYDRVILPPHISPRITAQKALLTIHQHPTSAYDPPELDKVLISKKFAAVLKRMLINFGISRATLFPGLDGIAADLAWDYKWGAYQWGK